jgi:precorrin-6A/cobalt-precorrin-6A reductase
VTDKVLILGGTSEAVELAARLVAEGHDVTVSLAGRTREPAPTAGKLRIGGFGGALELARHLMQEGYDRLIDATHPFANEISDNAREAAEISGVPLTAVTREEWQRRPGDDWTIVADAGAACDALPCGARAFLALGSQRIALFARRGDVHFLLRMVDEPRDLPPFASFELVTGRPGNVEEEVALMRSRAVTHLVCRNSGGKAGYAKIEAARRLHLPVIVIGRQA